MRKLKNYEEILAIDNLEVVYNYVALAVQGISIAVGRGEMVALLGSNGAGKSTILRAISGLLRPMRGKITRGYLTYKGQQLGNVSAQERVRLGITQVLEGRRVFENLTVRENLEAAYPLEKSNSELKCHLERIFQYFERLAVRQKAKAGFLSGGEQQMLAIGRALMTEPELLLLDEPSLGLAPILSKEIFTIVKEINRTENMTVLLVEQNAMAALELVDRGYLIENGRVVMHNKASILRENPDIRDFYLGGRKDVREKFANIKHYSRRKRWLS